MTLKDLQEIVAVTDFLWRYKDHEIFIDPFDADSYHVTETGQDTKMYSSFHEMANGFIIEGKALKDIINEITLL